MHVTGRAPGNVVENDRQVALVGDRLEVTEEPFLGRLVVVRGHVQEPVGTGLFAGLRERNRLVGGVGSGARNHWHSAGDDAHALANNLEMLLDSQRGRFARRPDGDDAVNSGFDLAFDEPFEGGVVGAAIAHRRDNCGHCTFKVHGID